jgi:hypothetical protein
MLGVNVPLPRPPLATGNIADTSEPRLIEAWAVNPEPFPLMKPVSVVVMAIAGVVVGLVTITLSPEKTLALTEVTLPATTMA